MRHERDAGLGAFHVAGEITPARARVIAGQTILALRGNEVAALRVPATSAADCHAAVMVFRELERAFGGAVNSARNVDDPVGRLGSTNIPDTHVPILIQGDF